MKTKNSFTKEDLLTGDIVVFRDGTLAVVLLEKEIFLCQYSGYESLDDYKEDLLSDVSCEESDILEVYRAEDNDVISFLDYYDGDQIFAREADKDYHDIVAQREKMLEKKYKGIKKNL